MGHEFQNAMAAQGNLTMPIDSQSPLQIGKQNVREHRSKYSCGTWMRNATSKDKMNLKMLAPSAVMPGIGIATDLDIQRTNECSDHRSDYREAS